MTRPTVFDPSRRRDVLACTAGPLAALALLGAVASRAPTLVLINESPSLPRGLYVRDLAATPMRGAVVAIRQPDAVRPYLSRLGMPAGVRLLKRVAATGGDRVCAGEGHVRLEDRLLPVRARDRQGAVLPRWRQCRRLVAGEHFLLGDTAGSFDSRYFGPASDAAIEGVYRRMLTW